VGAERAQNLIDVRKAHPRAAVSHLDFGRIDEPACLPGIIHEQAVEKAIFNSLLPLSPLPRRGSFE